MSGGGVTAGIDFALTLVSIRIDRPTTEARSSCGSNIIRHHHSIPARPTPPSEMLARMRERIAAGQEGRATTNARAAVAYTLTTSATR